MVAVIYTTNALRLFILLNVLQTSDFVFRIPAVYDEILLLGDWENKKLQDISVENAPLIFVNADMSQDVLDKKWPFWIQPVANDGECTKINNGF